MKTKLKDMNKRELIAHLGRFKARLRPAFDGLKKGIQWHKAENAKLRAEVARLNAVAAQLISTGASALDRIEKRAVTLDAEVAQLTQELLVARTDADQAEEHLEDAEAKVAKLRAALEGVTDWAEREQAHLDRKSSVRIGENERKLVDLARAALRETV